MEGKVNIVVSFDTLSPFLPGGWNEPNGSGDGEVDLPCGVLVERPDWFNPFLD